METLRPTYKLSVGVPGKSNAFLISEKLGIPERVIEAAQQHLSAEDKRLDAVLGQLDDLKLQLKASQDEVEGLKTRLPTSWMQPVRSAMSLSSRARMSWKLPAPRPAHWRRRSRARLTL